MESMQHVPESNWFVTLTYDEDSVPIAPDGQPTLLPAHGVSFRKRLRTHLGQSSSEFRFFFVGEYGDRTQRPHYHMIGFGLPIWDSKKGAFQDVSKLIEDKWSQGFVQVEPVTEQRMAYVAHYCTKKMTRPSDIRLGSRHPEFSQMSRRPALGDSFVASLKGTAKVVQVTGDVPSQYRWQGAVWPFSQRHKRIMRKSAGLPEKRMEIVALHPELQELHRELSVAPDLQELTGRRQREVQVAQRSKIFRRSAV